MPIMRPPNHNGITYNGTRVTDTIGVFAADVHTLIREGWYLVDPEIEIDLPEADVTEDVEEEA